MTPPETPNVITAPMPKHDQDINVVDDVLFVSYVDELATPLPTVKKNLLQAGLFLGWGENYYHCASLPNGCILLKIGFQHLINNRENLFEKTSSMKSLCEDVRCEDVSIVTISRNPTRSSSKGPVRITPTPRVTPLIITSPGPIPYSTDKVVP